MQFTAVNRYSTLSISCFRRSLGLKAVLEKELLTMKGRRLLHTQIVLLFLTHGTIFIRFIKIGNRYEYFDTYSMHKKYSTYMRNVCAWTS